MSRADSLRGGRAVNLSRLLVQADTVFVCFYLAVHVPMVVMQMRREVVNRIVQSVRAECTRKSK
jgi:hypothetical protein